MKKVLLLLMLLNNYCYSQNNQLVDSLHNLIGNNHTKNTRLYFLIARTYINSGNYDSAHIYLNKSLGSSKDSISPDMLLGIYEEFANLHLNTKENTKALVYINYADSLYKTIMHTPLKDSVNHPYNLKSIVLRRMGNYKEAIKYALKSLDISIQSKNYALASASYNSIGILYERLNDNKKAEEFYLRGLKVLSKDTIYSENVHMNLYGNLYMNLANSLQGQYKNSEAIKNYNKSIYYFGLLNNRHRLAYINNNIASLKSKIQQYDSAVFYAEKSLAIKIEIVTDKDLITNYRILSEANRKLNNNKKALKFALKELNIINNNPEIEIYNKLGSFLDISLTFEKNRQYKEALKYLNNYVTLNDSIFTKEKDKAITELQTKYETKQKEALILKLSNENLKKETELIKSRYTVYVILGLLLVVLSFALFLCYKIKIKLKLQLLEVNIKATEEEKKRIGKELHDGIAGSIIKLIHEVEEDEGSGLSQKLLKTYNEVRDLSHQLNNTPMHGELLFDSLFEVIPENKRNQIFTLNINPKYLTLIEPYSTHVLRIIQELITNNLKYSQASKTLIDIQFKDDLLKIKYIDNGIGAPNIKKGSGLKNIENRVAIVKGKTLIQSQEKGFEVKIEIPYKNEEHTNY